MAQGVAVIRGVLPDTATSFVDLKQTSFGTPTAAIIIACAGNSTNSTDTDAQMSIGFWDGTNKATHGIKSEDNLTTTTTQRTDDHTYGLTFMEGFSGGFLLTQYSISSITDGIRLTCSTDNTTRQRYVTVILLKGVSAAVGSIAAAGSISGTSTSASLGFAPKLILFSTIGNNVDNTQTSNSNFAIGVADVNGGIHCSGSYQRTGRTTSEWTTVYSDTYLCFPTRNSIDCELTVSNWGTDDFTIRNEVDADASYWHYLALGGADLSYEIGGTTTKTTTGTQSYTTTNQPDALMLALSQSTAVDTLNLSSDNESVSWGMSDGTNDYCHAIAGGDGLSTTNEQSMSHADRVMDLDSESSGFSALLDASVDSFNSTDFTLNYSVASGSAHRFWWLAFTSAGGGGGAANIWNLASNRDGTASGPTVHEVAPSL